MKYQCSRRSLGSCKRSAHFAGLAAFAAYLARPLLLSSQSGYGYFSSLSLALFCFLMALADSLTGLCVHTIFSFVVVKVRSVLRSESLVCLFDLSNAVSEFPVLAKKIGDPSSRTKGFSYSLARTDGGPSPGCYLGSVNASSICSRSTAGMRRCHDRGLSDMSKENPVANL